MRRFLQPISFTKHSWRLQGIGYRLCSHLGRLDVGDVPVLPEMVLAANLLNMCEAV